MSLISDYGFVLLILACAFGFFMAWGVGANDVANAMGTSVGSRALTIKQAIMIAMVFEFCGAYLAGGEVTETIKNGIVDAELIPPDMFILGMMSSLLAAGTWLLIASVRGWPVSTTHSIVGAVIGAYYYLKIVKIMYFDAPAAPYARVREPAETALIFLFAVIVSPLGYLLIGPLGSLTDRAAGSLF